jgi:hypothetical protein
MRPNTHGMSVGLPIPLTMSANPVQNRGVVATADPPGNFRIRDVRAFDEGAVISLLARPGYVPTAVLAFQRSDG